MDIGMIHYYVLDIAHYKIDTQYLTVDQRGLYIELCHYYLTKGPVPFDLSEICKVILPSIRPCRSIPQITAVLEKTFEKSKTGYINRRYQSVSNKTKTANK
jgi:uncharacterized protein YdaU (DUF1376 family)